MARRAAKRRARSRGTLYSTGVETLMVKPEWGTKRTCPKCSTRFYDLTNDNPVHCIECGTEWVPEPVLKSKPPLRIAARRGGVGEPVLKSKQPMAFEPAAQVAKEPAQDDELAAEDLAV